MAKTLPRRSEVPADHTWDLQSVFPSDAAWDDAYIQTGLAVQGLGRFAGKLGGSAGELLEALRARDQVLAAVSRLSVYAGMQLTGDRNEQAYVARSEQSDSLSARAAGAAAFFEPEILGIPAERLRSMIEEEPDLAVYRHYFDTLARQRAHIRSPEVESLLAEASDLTFSGYRIHDTLENADLKFATIKDAEGDKVEVQQGNVWVLTRSQDREVRKSAWEAYADGYISVKNTMAATLAAGVKRDVFYSRARNYASALEAALYPFNIPVEAFRNVLEAFRRHRHVWHRYWGIRRRALGVDKLGVYDTDFPLVRSERQISYEQASDIICAGMSPLGDEYIVPMRRGLFEQRWVDIYPNQGKGSGAFSYGTHGTHPFLMLNYDDTLESLSTLAHELGHSMHSYFSWESQPFVYANYSMFVAETASNFNQALVRAHLLETEKDPDFLLEVLAEAMSNFHRYLFIMPTLAIFELECHERVERGEGLTADMMSSLLADQFREGYGENVELDEARVGIVWAQFPHLFGNFYVFQYATGISAAAALAQGVLGGDEPAARRYVDFLRSGASLYPVDALRIAGIDMTTPEPIERAFGVLGGLIDRLDDLVGPGPLRGNGS